jgi:hypothetical protein
MILSPMSDGVSPDLIAEINQQTADDELNDGWQRMTSLPEGDACDDAAGYLAWVKAANESRAI